MIDQLRRICRMFATAFLGIAVSALLAAPASAQADTASADSRALIITPLSFVRNTDLDFGQIIPANADGTIFMDSNGAVTTTNGIQHIDGTQAPAEFWGYGSFNQRVLINIDANTYTLTRNGGTETMLFDQVTIGSRPPILLTTNPRRFRIINAQGIFAFAVSGRLQVGANQPAGTYTGQFSVTLEYE
ncbi:MAG: DUF4402 domain-containing protein [Erythrobacter sp.]